MLEHAPNTLCWEPVEVKLKSKRLSYPLFVSINCRLTNPDWDMYVIQKKRNEMWVRKGPGERLASAEEFEIASRL